VRVRKRKAQGQVVRGQDRQREFKRQGGTTGLQHQQSRFRSSSRQNLSVVFDESEYPKLGDVSDKDDDRSYQVVCRFVGIELDKRLGFRLLCTNSQISWSREVQQARFMFRNRLQARLF